MLDQIAIHSHAKCPGKPARPRRLRKRCIDICRRRAKRYGMHVACRGILWPQILHPPRAQMCGPQLSHFTVQHAYPAGHPGGRSGYHAKKGKLSEALVGPASADGHQGAAESNAQRLPRHAMALDVSICEQHQIEEEKVPAKGNTGGLNKSSSATSSGLRNRAAKVSFMVALAQGQAPRNQRTPSKAAAGP